MSTTIFQNKNDTAAKMYNAQACIWAKTHKCDYRPRTVKEYGVFQT